MIDKVFALNVVQSSTRVGGLLPDAYFEESSAIDMARSLAEISGKSTELKVTEDEREDGIVFRLDNGYFTYEVIRLRIAY